VEYNENNINKYITTTYEETRKTADNDFINRTKRSKNQDEKYNVIIPLTCLKKNQTGHNIVGFPAKECLKNS
jgi:hypothetical protein